MISDTSQLVSNITFTHIKSPGTFNMIVPIFEGNQEHKMYTSSNTLPLCQTMKYLFRFSRSTGVLDVGYVKSNP